MFSKTNKSDAAALAVSAAQTKKSIPSVISADMHILGNLVGDGLVDVDGSIAGNIRAEQVTVRANGKITGDVVAERVHVYGTVHGLIRAHAVHLYSSCHVEGIIIHQTLSVEDGAFIDGKFKRNDKPFDIKTDNTDDEGDNDGFIESLGSNSLRLIG